MAHWCHTHSIIFFPEQHWNQNKSLIQNPTEISKIIKTPDLNTVSDTASNRLYLVTYLVCCQTSTLTTAQFVLFVAFIYTILSYLSLTFHTPGHSTLPCTYMLTGLAQRSPGCSFPLNAPSAYYFSCCVFLVW